MWMVSPLLCVVAWVARVAGTGDSSTTVNGTRGRSVSLPPGIPVGPDIAQLVWRRFSPRAKIVTYSNKNSDYYGSEEYKRRIILHPRNFSLEIHDLQKSDSDDYEVSVTAFSGAQTQNKMRLEVYDPVSGTVIMVQYIVKTCNIILICSEDSGNSIFRWWRGGEVVGTGSYYHLQQHGEAKGDEEVLYKCEARNPVSNEMTEVWLGDICGKNKSDEILVLEGALGKVARLTPEILKAPKITNVVWRILSDSTKIAECMNGKLTYLNTKKYKQRIKCHPGDCSLIIHDQQKEDTDVYEVIVTASTGTRTRRKVQLKVADPDLRTSYNGWKVATVILIVIVVILILYLVYNKYCIKLRDSRSRGNKGQVETQPLENQKKEPATDAPE
ncbi:SLAM family member 8-like [Mobula birostris]|uniref:SLAM family member 8-like n=1 Tax=Mobula birostris TaxID=1983395 RepID=UPI003B28A3FF